MARGGHLSRRTTAYNGRDYSTPMRTSAAPGGPSDGGESNLTPGPSQPTVGPVPGTAQGAPAETPLYKVLFGCWADLGFGETLRVTGECDALGNGDKTKSIALTKTKGRQRGNLSFWSTLKPTIAEQSPLTYKYLVMSGGGEFVRMENLEGYRTLQLDPGSPQVKTMDMMDDAAQPESESMSAAAEQVLRKDGQDSDTGVDQLRQLQSVGGVIIVSNLLPVNIQRVIVDGRVDFHVSWNHDSLLSKKWRGNKAVESLRVLWVGGVHIDDTMDGGGGLFDGSGDPAIYSEVDEMEEQILQARLQAFNCIPVLARAADLDHHHSFCRETLFPLFNGVIDVYGSVVTTNGRERARTQWERYKRVNQAFSKKVMEVYQPGDLIWVHNYQLILMPSYLIKKLPGACICFFMHQPWPSSELYRTLSKREEVLRGMLNADIIGFHSFDHARNFLTACTRLLGLTSSIRKGGSLTVDYNGRHIEVLIDHVSIEPDMLAEWLHGAEVKAAIAGYTEKFKGKKLILALDELYRLSGITLKLLAFEQLLEDSPHLAKNVVMLQIGIEAFYERGTDFEDVCRECAEVADRINAKHIHASGSPVVLYKRVHTLDVVNRLALMSIADVFMNSAIRMGLNLKPFEYVFANERKGVLVLSEYNCAVVPLGGCLSTNPFNLNSSAQVLDMALSMPETERTARNGRDLEYVTTHATSNWALTVLLEMARISHRDDKAQYSYVGYGLGLCYRVLRIRADFQKLNFRKVQQAYKVSQRRLFLLDYGGTLLGGLGGHTWLSNASNKISAAQLQQLEALASDKRNLIFIVSGRSQAMMEATFASCPNVGLAAELGYYLKLPKCLHDSPEDAASSSEKGAAVEPGGSSADPPSLGRSQQQLQSGSFRRLPLEGWERVGGRHGHQIVDETWREVTVRIMEQYRKRTPGTRVEQKQSSVTWSFRDTDLEYGKMQAAELKTHLESMVIRDAQYPVVTVSGDRYLEVRLKGVNKGECLLGIMERLSQTPSVGPPDFAICIGNDDHDEYMYSALHALDGTGAVAETEGWYNCLSDPTRQNTRLPTDFKGFSCIVGQKASTARFYLDEPEETWQLLEMLHKTSAQSRMAQSMVDLRSASLAFDGATSDSSPLSARASDSATRRGRTDSLILSSPTKGTHTMGGRLSRHSRMAAGGTGAGRPVGLGKRTGSVSAGMASLAEQQGAD